MRQAENVSFSLVAGLARMSVIPPQQKHFVAKVWVCHIQLRAAEPGLVLFQAWHEY